jgi:hypothetical protein
MNDARQDPSYVDRLTCSATCPKCSETCPKTIPRHLTCPKCRPTTCPKNSELVSWATIRESENLLTGARLLPRASPQQKRVAAAQPAHRSVATSDARTRSATAARPGHAEYALAFMRLSTRFAVDAPHRGACRCGNVRVTCNDGKRLSIVVCGVTLCRCEKLRVSRCGGHPQRSPTCGSHTAHF